MGKNLLFVFCFLVLSILNLYGQVKIGLFGVRSEYVVKDSYLNMKTKHAGSLLNWTDKSLKGVKVSLETELWNFVFQKVGIEAAFFGFQNGYFLDDDIWAKFQEDFEYPAPQVVSAAHYKTRLFEIEMKGMTRERGLGLTAGGCLRIKEIEHLDSKGWGKDNRNILRDSSESGYDLLQIWGFFGVSGNLKKRLFYGNFFSRAGIGFYQGEADWGNNYRTYRGGLSWIDRGILINGEGCLEGGIIMGKMTFYLTGRVYRGKSAGYMYRKEFKADGVENIGLSSVGIWDSTYGVGMRFMF